MTSKEALSDLLNMADYCLEEDERKQIKKEYKIVLKDLEILEILKEALYVHKTNAKDLLELRAIFDLETYDEEERQKNQKIKEWLENVN